MVNSTNNGKKIGKPAGSNDKTIITGMGMRKTSKDKELEANGKIFIDIASLMAGEFISIRAYDNEKERNKEKDNNDITH